MVERTAALTLAAVGDLHTTKASQGKLQPIFDALSGRAEVLLLCGDLTDSGSPEEARILAGELTKAVNIPKLAVLGNHDYEADCAGEVRRILSDVGVTVFDGDAVVIGHVAFVGVKGFGGGFGRRMLEPWGEPATKAFVQAAVDESLKLESALARLHVEDRIVFMHYSPVEGTVVGEPPEVMPFLGCSRLEEPLNRHGVTAVFHGHSHYGAAESRTHDGIPVYNVAAPLLRRLQPDQPPFRFLTVPYTAPAANLNATPPHEAAPLNAVVPR
jgi:Icc-related predicted phosphoesterase